MSTTQEVSNEKQRTEQQIIEEQAKKIIDGITKPVQFTPDQFKEFLTAQQRQIEALAAKQNEYFLKFAEVLKPKAEAGVPSSPAGGAGGAGDDLKKVAEYLVAGEGKWTLNKNEYINKWRDNYRRAIVGSTMKEAVTTTNVPGIIFDRDVLLIPGGQSIVNIRPFVNYKDVPDGADTFNWYKLDKVTFASITEGTTIAASSQTASRIQGTVVPRGALQRIGFLQERSIPFDLAAAVNETMMAASLHDEATLVLEEAATATGANLTNWIKGSDGTEITADDIASVTLTFDGMNKALELLETQGFNRSDATAFLHPQQHAQLMSNAVKTLGAGIPSFNDTAVVNGIIERYLGCRIVVTPAVYLQDNATNDAYRAIVCVPSALGLASKGSVEVEADRRIEDSQTIVTGRHYVDAAVIESTGYVRISTTKV